MVRFLSRGIGGGTIPHNTVQKKRDIALRIGLPECVRSGPGLIVPATAVGCGAADSDGDSLFVPLSLCVCRRLAGNCQNGMTVPWNPLPSNIIGALIPLPNPVSCLSHPERKLSRVSADLSQGW